MSCGWLERDPGCILLSLRKENREFLRSTGCWPDWQKTIQEQSAEKGFCSHPAPVCLLQNSPATTGKGKSALNCGSFQRGNIRYSPLPAAESMLMAFQVTGFQPLLWNTGKEVSRGQSLTRSTPGQSIGWHMVQPGKTEWAQKVHWNKVQGSSSKSELARAR